MKPDHWALSALLIAGILLATSVCPHRTAIAAPDTGPTYYVDAATGSDSNPGTQVAPLRTITKALSVALPGGVGVIGSTIQVAPGTYDAKLGEKFPLLVPDGVSLIGDEASKGNGPAPALISGGGPVPGSKSNEAAVTAGHNATIAGFTITHASDAQSVVTSGVYLDKSGATVRNNTIRGNGSYGVLVDDGGGGHILSGNVITGQIHGAGVGVKSGQELATQLQNNVITGNEIGVKIEDETLDLGGGDTSSAGGNTLACNTLNDVWVRGKMTVAAKKNAWAHNPIVVVADGKGDLLRSGGAVVQTAGNRIASVSCAK